MICKTKEQAERIANYGADKMDDQGYTYQHTAGGLYLCTKPGQTPYIVDTVAGLVNQPGGKNCTCAFAEENRQFQVCKHSVWVDRKLEEADLIAREADFNEWEEYGRHDLAMGKY